MRILTVVGARPQFIKAAMLGRVLRDRHTEFLVHTGQHYDDELSALLFRELDIAQPDVHLGIGSGSHAEQTAGILVPLERLMQEQRPDWVVVFGDTNSTLAAALAAAKLNLPIAHVEAGLRSFNAAMPEEINRIITDRLAQLRLCPTLLAVENLQQEGIRDGVVLTGDIMVDAVLHYAATDPGNAPIYHRLRLDPARPYAVATIHRPANTNDPEKLAAILTALNTLDMPVIFPVHPRTQRVLHQIPLTLDARVRLIKSVSYLDMLVLVRAAAVVITDSGSLQKEAYTLHTPCVTVRTETEYPETVEAGWNRLAKATVQTIMQAVREACSARPTTHPAYFGTGNAAQQIVAALEAAYQERRVIS